MVSIESPPVPPEVFTNPLPVRFESVEMFCVVLALKELPEIGKRMAETVIAELHGKVEAFLSVDELAGLEVKSKAPPKSAAADEAIAALVTLGEAPDRAAQRVARAVERAMAEGRDAKNSGELLSLVYGTP